MEKRILVSLIFLLVLISGCAENNQVVLDDLTDSNTIGEKIFIHKNFPPKPVISVDAKIDEINYIFTSSTYGGFIETLVFTVTNTGEEAIDLSVEYTIVDLAENFDSVVILNGVNEEINLSKNLESGETQTFTLALPKKRIKTGHEFIIQLKLRDEISEEKLITIEKTETLP